MTIGRTDDPENPLLAPALEAASLFGAGSRNPSGPADMLPHQQAGHMNAIDHPSRSVLSCIPGAVHTCEEAKPTRQSRPECAITTRLLRRYAPRNDSHPPNCAERHLTAAGTPSVRAISRNLE